MTLDGWSEALGAPFLAITWNYIDVDIDDAWRLRSVPIAILNTRSASESGEQLRCIVDEVLRHSNIVGSDSLRIHTITSDNQASVKIACDLLTNHVGSVRCVVHTLALCVNDAFKEGEPWQLYLEHVNKVTYYFNYHAKANFLLKEMQSESGVTEDLIHCLKRDFATRWHSRLGAMVTLSLIHI